MENSFLTYMGIEKSDIRIDVQYSENLVEKNESNMAYLEKFNKDDDRVIELDHWLKDQQLC